MCHKMVVSKHPWLVETADPILEMRKSQHASFAPNCKLHKEVGTGETGSLQRP